ncbi:MAG: hypothetical protein MUO19_03815 [Dehalococcoidales bacterium]|nr:hypothetical protein [Dehalococcoidales bacterium]
MKKAMTISFVSLVILAVLLGAVSCSQGISEMDYQAVQDELAGAKSLVTGLQDEIASAQKAVLENTEQMVDLNQLYTASVEKLASLEDQYAELSALNEDIQTQIEAYQSEITDLESQLLEAMATPPEPPRETVVPITEEGIEQALLARISQERVNAGLNELLPGTNLPDWADQNSQAMSVAKRTLEFADFLVPFQAAFIAGGYGTVDRIVNGAMLIWQSNAVTYNGNFLGPAALYGAVAIVKAGDIYYITFLASNFP